jgi:hypothetical protein
MGKKKPVKLWKNKSIFWDLEYWMDLDVRNCKDVMHIEKNVCDIILGTLLNIKGKKSMDTGKVRPLLDAHLKKDEKYEYRTGVMNYRVKN